MNDLSPEQLKRIYDKLDLTERPPNTPPPPSTIGSSNGRIPPMSDWEPRVVRLEIAFCVAFVMIFGAIISAYLMTAQKIERADDKIGGTTVAITELRGSVKVLDERTIETNKRLERIESKLDALAVGR